MRIAGIQKTSFIDYPGKISIVIFLAGCNYSCYYCHNKNILNDPMLLDIESILDFLRKRKKVVDSIVITGGEPTLQDDLIDFMKQIKEIGYQLKLDTNGSNEKMIKDIINNNLIDYIAIDYKAPSYMYEKITGFKADNTLNVIRFTEKSEINYEVRTTMIPEIRKNELIYMAKEMPLLKRYLLQPYILESRSLSYNLEEMVGYIKHIQPNTFIRGRF